MTLAHSMNGLWEAGLGLSQAHLFPEHRFVNPSCGNLLGSVFLWRLNLLHCLLSEERGSQLGAETRPSFQSVPQNDQAGIRTELQCLLASLGHFTTIFSIIPCFQGDVLNTVPAYLDIFHGELSPLLEIEVPISFQISYDFYHNEIFPIKVDLSQEEDEPAV